LVLYARRRNVGGRGRTRGIHDIADTGKSKTHKGGEERLTGRKHVGRSKRVKTCNSDGRERGSGNPARPIHKEP
jgi:hypothetical protein